MNPIIKELSQKINVLEERTRQLESDYETLGKFVDRAVKTGKLDRDETEVFFIDNNLDYVND